MLRDGLAGKRNSTAFFVNRHGKILSSTDPARTVGSLLELDADLLALPDGSATSRVVIRDGCYAIMGCTVSSGYREFKVSDGYVIAVVFESFGAVREGRASRHDDTHIENGHGDLQGREFATFLVDGLLFALDVGHVLEARPAEEIFGASMVGPARSIGMRRLHAGMEAEQFIWVFDLGLVLRATPTCIDSRSQVVVVQCGGRCIGLLVGELDAVAAFETGQVKESPLAGESRLVKGLVKANGGRLLLQLL
jgi:chemotaxis signal transduction protein